jgi:molybdenum cofactor cytidylyltransferase
MGLRVAEESNSKHRIAAIVLAAGESSRFSPHGEPKQLAMIDGEPMIARVVREVHASAADTVLVVLGHEFEKVSAVINGFHGIKIINNPDYPNGLSSSLKAGLAQAVGFDAIMFVLGDLPGLASADMDSVISIYRDSTAPLACAMYEGRPAHPVIFRKDLWPELEKLTGDIGGREVVIKHIDEVVMAKLPGTACISDVDTIDDYLPFSGGSESGKDSQANC